LKLQESFRLEGKEFCVWGTEKQKLEKLIAAHGGTITQNAGKYFTIKFYLEIKHKKVINLQGLFLFELNH